MYRSVQHTISSWGRALLLASCLMTGGVLFPATAAPVKQDKVAIIIANETYDNTAPVPFAAKDADAMAGLFSEVFHIPAGKILRYKNLTKGQLEFLFGTRTSAGHLATKIKKTNTDIFVYFSGHGSRYYNEKRNRSYPYILGTDSRPDSLVTTGYPLGQLVDNLKKLQKSHASKGKVVLMLEAGFSGKDQNGELVKGVNAPALGAPVALKEIVNPFALPQPSPKALWKHIPVNNDQAAGARKFARSMLPKPAQGETSPADRTNGQENMSPVQHPEFVLISAAGQDKIARRNKHITLGLFTDTLIDGFYGEADAPRFQGNQDGKITVREIKGFLEARLTAQTPAIISNKPATPLVKLDADILPRSETLARKHKELLTASLWLSSGTVDDGQEYLNSCTYCPLKKEISLKIRQKQERLSVCRIENQTAHDLLKNGNSSQIRAFLEDCLCCTYRQQLESRLEEMEEKRRIREARIAYRKKQLERTRQQQASELNAWLKAIRSGQPEHYREYLKYFPNGKKAAFVQNILKKLEEEDRIWSKAIRSHSLRKYKYYLSRYPEGRYSNQALKWIKENKPKG